MELVGIALGYLALRWGRARRAALGWTPVFAVMAIVTIAIQLTPAM